MLKKLFYICNFFLIILYLYPGSIIGYIFYRNLYKQPQITNDFLGLSSNHFYTFLIISLIGLFSFKDLKKIINYLILLSIFLELSHFIIPNRTFEYIDLLANIIGVLFIIVLLKLLKWQKSH